MQAVEAMTRLIEIGDWASQGSNYREPRTEEQQEQDSVAVAVAQAMLNTALPVARWRCFVRIDSGREKGREFTVCAVNIEDIVSALYPLSTMAREVYITLWEQRPTGADMVVGFQGWTRSSGKKKMREFLDSLCQYSASSLAN